MDTVVLAALGKGLSGMYKDYNPPTDRKIAKRMIRIVYDSLSKEDRPVELNRIDSLFAGDVERYVDFLYDNSIFASRQQFEAFLKDPDIEKLKNDPAYRLNKSVMQSFGRDAKKLSEIAKKYRRGTAFSLPVCWKCNRTGNSIPMPISLCGLLTDRYFLTGLRTALFTTIILPWTV